MEYQIQAGNIKTNSAANSDTLRLQIIGGVSRPAVRYHCGTPPAAADTYAGSITSKTSVIAIHGEGEF